MKKESDILLEKDEFVEKLCKDILKKGIKCKKDNNVIDILIASSGTKFCMDWLYKLYKYRLLPNYKASYKSVKKDILNIIEKTMKEELKDMIPIIIPNNLFLESDTIRKKFVLNLDILYLMVSEYGVFHIRSEHNFTNELIEKHQLKSNNNLEYSLIKPDDKLDIYFLESQKMDITRVLLDIKSQKKIKDKLGEVFLFSILSGSSIVVAKDTPENIKRIKYIRERVKKHGLEGYFLEEDKIYRYNKGEFFYTGRDNFKLV